MGFLQWVAIVFVFVIAFEFKSKIGSLCVDFFNLVKKVFDKFVNPVVKACQKLFKFFKHHTFKAIFICLLSIIGLAVVIFAIFETRTYLSNKTNAWLDINEVGKNENYPVDMVYLWCEDTPARAQLRQEWKEKLGLAKKNLSAEVSSVARFVSNDELKYSLRSVEKYAPWVNKIYIVTDNQVPKWLNLKHPKIKIIDQRDIMPKGAMPVFSSVPIEYAIPNIQGLSEHFIYANDDMMFANPVKKEDFFKNGKPIYIFSKSLPQKIAPRQNYLFTINSAYKLASSRFSKYKALRRESHHNIDPYVKSTMIEVNEKFKKELYNTMRSRFRSNDDIQRIFYSYYAILNDKAYYKIQRRGYNMISYLTGKYQRISDYFTIADAPKLKKSLQKLKMFCTNDMQNVNDKHRQVYGLYMDEIFPEKSQFEK